MTGVILILLVVALAAGLAVQYRALDRIKRNAADLADSLRLAQDRVKQMEPTPLRRAALWAQSGMLL